MVQLLLHLVGDYILQTDWMANKKTTHISPCLFHSLVYSLPFLLIGSWQAVAVIGLTHYVIDRFRLVRYVLKVKELKWIDIFRQTEKWEKEGFIRSYISNLKIYWDLPNEKWGYNSSTRPVWLTTWLIIIADNTLHLIINYFALKYL